jgi:hypothetical protein
MPVILVVGIVLLVLWSVGMGTRYYLGGFVHVALVIALVLIIIWLLRAVFRAF